MTPQEQTMLDELIARVDGTQLPEKDPEAAERIQQWSQRNPNAAYILAQTVLVQNYALEQAKAQIQSLQQRAAQQPALQASKPTSFLGGLFGHHEEPRAAAPPPQQSGYTQVPQYGAPQSPYAQAGYGAPQGYAAPASGGSSFLRSAATTAAGVAAGALAFEGIESLMHGFGHAAGFGGGYGFADAVEPQETIINNYYDTPAGSGTDPNAEIQQFSHEGDNDLSTQQDTAADVNVDGGDQQLQTADTDLPDVSDDNSGSFDDASYDDGGGFDDSMDNV